MTLLDLFKLLKRYSVLVIVLPLVCALGCYAYFSILKLNEETYTASARIVVTTHVQDVNGLAAGHVRAAQAKNVGLTIKCSKDDNTKTETVTVIGPDAQQAVDLANSIVEATCAEAAEFVVTGEDEPFNARIEKAGKAKKSEGNGDLLKYIAIALFVGLFLAVCIVVLIDMVKRSVKSVEGVKKAVDLPVLDILPVKDGGDRLLANVRFAAKTDNLKTACIVPVGETSADEVVASALASAAQAEGLDARVDSEPVKEADLTIVRCDSLARGMKTAYMSRKADATVLVVRQWSDSLRALENAVEELKLADANLVGIVFAEAK